VRRVEKVEYLATVNVPRGVKHIGRYLQREIETGEFDVADRKVISVDILDSDLIEEKTVGFEISPKEAKLPTKNRITYL